jgi:hypothetical protein
MMVMEMDCEGEGEREELLLARKLLPLGLPTKKSIHHHHHPPTHDPPQNRPHLYQFLNNTLTLPSYYRCRLDSSTSCILPHLQPHPKIPPTTKEILRPPQIIIKPVSNEAKPLRQGWYQEAQGGSDQINQTNPNHNSQATTLLRICDG